MNMFLVTMFPVPLGKAGTTMGINKTLKYCITINCSIFGIEYIMSGFPLDFIPHLMRGIRVKYEIKGCHSTEVTRMSAYSKGGENQEKSSKLLFLQIYFRRPAKNCLFYQDHFPGICKL